jgi:hypothetical protein
LALQATRHPERGSLKQTVPSRTVLSLGAVGTLALVLAFAGGTSAVAQRVPPPVPTATPVPDVTLNPVPPTASPTPAPTAAPTPVPRGRGRGRATPAPASSAQKTPEPTPTPTSPAFASLDGTWEVQVQYIDHTTYAYFDLTQKLDALAGAFRYEGKKYTLDGTYDGHLIKLVAKMPQGNVTFSGYVENASDMVGLIDFGSGKSVAFTAEHRAAPIKNILKRGGEAPPRGSGGAGGGGYPH